MFFVFIACLLLTSIELSSAKPRFHNGKSPEKHQVVKLPDSGHGMHPAPANNNFVFQKEPPRIERQKISKLRGACVFGSLLALWYGSSWLNNYLGYQEDMNIGSRKVFIVPFAFLAGRYLLME